VVTAILTTVFSSLSGVRAMTAATARPATYRSLGDFIARLEAAGQLVRVTEPVSTQLEMTEIQTRLLAEDGPAALFENPIKADGTTSAMPVLVNLFGTVERVAWGLGCEVEGLSDLGERLAALQSPDPVNGMRDALDRLPLLRAAMAMRSKVARSGPVMQVVREGDDADLTELPMQSCWPGEPAPLITWPLVVTRGPGEAREDAYNVGVYRMQVLDERRAIMRWLAHRGGARHHRLWAERGEPMPVAVVIGADPGTMLAAVTPVPELLSEYRFAGLLRGAKLELASCRTIPLQVPAHAEIVLEGHVSVDETAPEGPYGDHTGYYNAVEHFPVFTVSAITRRQNPIYLSTFTGRPPDEPSVMARALNEVFLPLLRRQFPEIVDCYLPPEACSYRVAVVSIKKRYPGQARRVMMGLWSMLPQFSYTKLVIVVDDDIDARDWKDVIWAIATRADAARDVMIVDNTPIDYLDFASPRCGLGAKMGIDATRKIGGETDRKWGEVIRMSDDVIRAVDEKWAALGLPGSGRAIWRERPKS
jgi:4-hydroxy-3-polyprenylbenzoate decarboxylase